MIVCTLSVSLAVQLVGCGGAPPPSRPSGTFHAGAVFADETPDLIHKFELRNATGRRVHILGERHSCDCTSVEMPTNPEALDCAFDSAREGLHNRTLHSGVFPARSAHPGGVNALMMDGSTRFVTSGVETRTWRALGTINGGEAVSGEP